MRGYQVYVCLVLLLFVGTVYCQPPGQAARRPGGGGGRQVSSEFQFENLNPRGNAESMWRSEAGENKTLRIDLTGRKSFTLDLCPAPRRPRLPVVAHIENIRYSNDGPEDRIRISLNNNQFVGEFVTESVWNWGHHWNVFYDTGKVGGDFGMMRGRHKLRFGVRTDAYGVEFDSIVIKAINQRPGVALICS